jgi:hypothetical protein
MKETLLIVLFFVAAVVFVGGLTYVLKGFNNATTPVYVTSPKPGIECAVATTADGVAIDCWKL